MARIRRAGPDDAATVRAITRAAYAKWVPLIGREPLPMAADQARAVAQHLVLLWCDERGEGGEVGEVAASIELIERPDHLLIENLAVRPERQGEGLGAALLAEAERLAAEQGKAEVRLYTNAAFAANLAFYARRGYLETGREVMVPGSVTVHMSKRVGDS